MTMGQIKDISKIKKKAEEFGNPLAYTEFIGDGIVFVYRVGDGTISHSYNNLSRGIDEEIAWLERLLTTEI